MNPTTVPGLPGIAAGWRAEELFLGWLVSLPPGIDPSLAATAALARLEALAGPGPGTGELGRLRALLEETMGRTGPTLELLAARTERRKTA